MAAGRPSSISRISGPRRSGNWETTRTAQTVPTGSDVAFGRKPDSACLAGWSFGRARVVALVEGPGRAGASPLGPAPSGQPRSWRLSGGRPAHDSQEDPEGQEVP